MPNVLCTTQEIQRALLVAVSFGQLALRLATELKELRRDQHPAARGGDASTLNDRDIKYLSDLIGASFRQFEQKGGVVSTDAVITLIDVLAKTQNGLTENDAKALDKMQAEHLGRVAEDNVSRDKSLGAILSLSGSLASILKSNNTGTEAKDTGPVDRDNDETVAKARFTAAEQSLDRDKVVDALDTIVSILGTPKTNNNTL